MGGLNPPNPGQPNNWLGLGLLKMGSNPESGLISSTQFEIRLGLTGSSGKLAQPEPGLIFFFLLFLLAWQPTTMPTLTKLRPMAKEQDCSEGTCSGLEEGTHSDVGPVILDP